MIRGSLATVSPTSMPMRGRGPRKVDLGGQKNNAPQIKSGSESRFSISRAFGNFVKGLVSPITTMFSSTQNFLIGMGMIAGGALLLVATGGAAAPLLLAAGLGMGIYQLGKGVSQFLAAKNSREAENAFFDIGGGTSAIALSVVGAKASLKGVGVDASKMSYLQATVRNVREVPTSFTRTCSSFTTGQWSTNLSSTFTRLYNVRTKPPAKLRGYSESIHSEAKSQFQHALEEVQSIFPDELKPSIEGRPKGVTSILDKLMRKADKGTCLDDLATARGEIGDLIGTRLVLEDASPAQIDLVVKSLAKAVRKRQIIITEINNYRGPNGKPYFTDEHMQILGLAAKDGNQKIVFVEGGKLVKPSGYTTAQMNVRHQNGALGEFQIRGKEVNALAEVEHIPYDLRQGKDLSRGIPRLAKLYSPVKKAVGRMTQQEYSAYMNYLAEYYSYVRNAELGLPAVKPALPSGIGNILEIDGLVKVAQLAHG